TLRTQRIRESFLFSFVSFVSSVLSTRVFSGSRRPEMLPQQVSHEVAIEVAPHRVDVVAVVLGVVVLHEEGRTLHAVVVLFPALGFTRPCEADLLDARLFQTR